MTARHVVFRNMWLMLVYMKRNLPHPFKIQQKPLSSGLPESKHQLSTFNSWIWISVNCKNLFNFLHKSPCLSDARQTKLLLYLNHVLKVTYFSMGSNSNNSERKSFWQSITGHQPSAVMHLQFLKILSSISCFYK